MNKKLIALAVAGACVAPAALAQTANPVILYGKVYATMDWVEATGGTQAQNDATKRRMRVEDQASRLGVRGTEDLGGGLKAFFQLETAFRPDSNNTTFAARNSGVGLQGGWGSFLLGRWDTPFKLATTAVDPFGDVTIGGIKMALNDQSNFDRRDQNVLQYWSPNWAGVAFRLHMQANEAKTATADPKDIGASVTFTRGPIYLFYAYEKHDDQTGGLGASATVAGAEEKGHAVGGTFAFGPIKVGLVGERFKKTGRTDQKPWLANVVFTAGSHQFAFQYETLKGGSAPGAAEPKCNAASIGWQYNMSRRTFVLAQYARVKNDNTESNCGSNTFAIPGMAGGQDPKGLTLGMSHVF